MESNKLLCHPSLFYLFFFVSEFHVRLDLARVLRETKLDRRAHAYCEKSYRLWEINFALKVGVIYD